MVYLFPEDKFKHIFNIKHALGFLTRIEISKFKGTRHCYNYQIFNYASENSSFNRSVLSVAVIIKNRRNIKCAKCKNSHT